MSIRLVFQPKTGWSNEAKSVPISYRELELLCLVGQGNDYKKAAELMGIKYPTVKNYMHKIAKKLCAGNIAHAIVIALQAGMLQIEMKSDDWPFDDKGKRIAPDPDWVKKLRDDKG